MGGSAAMAIGWVDAAMLGVLLLSIAVGIWRGFVFELMSIAGWLVAWVAAQWFAPQFARHVPVGVPGSSLNLAVTLSLLFLAVLILWALCARLVRMLLRATPLSGVDRLLGAGFGAARALVLLLVVATVVALTPASASAAWRGSTGASWLQGTLRQLTPWLPSDLARQLPA